MTVASVSSFVGVVYTVQAVTFFYRVQKRGYLWRFVALPILAISFLGILLAIVFGQIHRYDQAAKRHAESASAVAVVRPTIPPTVATVPNARMTPTPATPIGHPAPTFPFSKTLPPQRPVTTEPRVFQPMPTRSLAAIDQRCIGGFPMRLPQQSAWHHAGTITAMVPRWAVVPTIFKTQNAVHGFLDPEYRADQRVLVHPGGAGPNARLMAVVPADMTVQIGQKVEIAGAHASHRFACRYIPNLLVR